MGKKYSVLQKLITPQIKTLTKLKKPTVTLHICPTAGAWWGYTSSGRLGKAPY
jgi:hypothetical protein